MNCFESKFKFAIPGDPVQRCTVRWPTDEEYLRYREAVKSEDVPAGGDFSRSVPMGIDSAAFRLFKEIRIDGDPLDEAGAGEVIMRLLDIELVEQPTLTQGRIHLHAQAVRKLDGTFRNDVHFSFRVPDPTQRREWRRTAVEVKTNRRTQVSVWSSNTRESIRLFDAIVDSTEYDGPVPAAHKSYAATEVMNALNAMFAAMEDDDPES